MLDRGHDLDFPPDANQILLTLNLGLLDRLDRHLCVLVCIRVCS